MMATCEAIFPLWGRLQKSSDGSHELTNSRTHEQQAENWYGLDALEKAIRAMHALVGNVAADDHHLVLGTGSTQLINAVFYGLTKVHGPRAVTQVRRSTRQ